MKIYREVNYHIKSSDLRLGDRIDVYLSDLGVFKATVQDVVKDDENNLTYVTFMFDKCICDRCMNAARTNLGGYDTSDMKSWLDDTVFNLFPDELKNIMTRLTLPTYEMIFGVDEWGKRSLKITNDTQFVLMKDRRNRVSDFCNEPDSYWVRNPASQSIDAESFGLVYADGTPSLSSAVYPYGVRPIFTIEVEGGEVVNE